MIKLRFLAVGVFAAASVFPLVYAGAALPDYKLGDVAVEDVVAPLQLSVVNPDATDTLKREISERIPAVVRRTISSAAEAEAELRASVISARGSFLAEFAEALNGRAPVPADVDSPVYLKTIRDVANEVQKNLPVARLAPLWVRGADDEAVVTSLLQPVREVMAQSIVADGGENSFPPDQPVRLIHVQSVTDSPSLQELESFGVITTANSLISLSRARRLVENHFLAGQEDMGRFASTFVRTNAYPAPGLTEILRVRRIDGITVSDNYEPAQIIVKRGQVIDRKVLSVLSAMREKNFIGTLQTKLDQEQAVTGQLTQQTKWIAVSLGGIGVVLVLILWRLRSRPVHTVVPVTATYPVLPVTETHALTNSAMDSAWRNRVMVAEGKAERAQEAIRTGALAWMREKIFQTLFHQRAELLLVHQKAEGEMREFELRLERLHTALQGRISAYEKRIEELERELAAKGEENRELIGARITIAKQRLSGERDQFGSN